MKETRNRAAEFDDLSLVHQAREGSRDAFETIVVRHQAVVRRILWRMLGNPQDVDDVAQEVFLSLLQAVDGFRRESKFQTWLLSITRHKAIDWLRNRERSERTATGAVDQLVDRQIAAATRAGSGPVPLEQEALQHCLEQLNESHRILVQAFYFEGQRATELAQKYGQATSAIRTRLMRIRRSLAKCIERRLTR